ncbi:hypothetical protein E2C01_018020 [Portunus trituberculatus]|uniref:Uncharacterized protein n=1 Tax=Portunus trituberculatus TaxID=210409 RepID=A0A5B7DUD6_PORTR|nr:hypothetical protein [Portunus trituberculatus]
MKGTKRRKKGRKVLLRRLYENIKRGDFTHQPTCPCPPESGGAGGGGEQSGVWEYRHFLM